MDKLDNMSAKGGSAFGGKKLFILTILIVSLALTGCAVKKSVKVDNNAQPASSTPTGGQVEQKDAVKIGNDKINVFNIYEGKTIFSPVTIFGQVLQSDSGRAIAFENNLIIELRNKDHEPLVKESTKIKPIGAGNINYSITLNFDFKNIKKGFVAVYELSAKDGSELNLVEIPVYFGNSDISTWQTYENEELGFEFKYPSEFEKIDAEDVILELSDNSNKTIILGVPEGIKKNYSCKDVCWPNGVVVYVYKSQEARNINEWITEKYKLDKYQKEEVEIGGLPGVKLTRLPEGPISYIIGPIQNNNFIELVVFLSSSGRDDIIKTFKFTN